MPPDRTYLVNLCDPLPAFAWPGGYPLLWITNLDRPDCATLCVECAEDARRNDSEVVSLIPDIHWEGPPEFCDGCGAEIPSAYGDPEEGRAEVQAERIVCSNRIVWGDK